MNVKQLYFIGYNGEIQKPVRADLKSPLVELDTNYPLPGYQPIHTSVPELSLLEARSIFGAVYKTWGRFGYLGDLIAVKMVNTGDSYLCILDYIGRLAIVKPGLAVDLVPIIKVSQYDYYFVGVKRKYNPGKGLPALMGGFIDVHGYHLDTPIETIINEADQEIGLKMRVIHADDLLTALPIRVPVLIDYRGQDCRGELVYQGIVPTGENENLPSLGLKRVYQTTVYALLLDMTKTDLNEDKLKDWLRAGDDADELVVVNLKETRSLEFGLKHHEQIFDSLMNYLAQIDNF